MKRRILKEEIFSKFVDEVYDLRDKCIFAVLYSCGCRTSELIKLRVQDVDLENKQLNLLDSKKHVFSKVPINSTTVQLLREYLDGLAHGGLGWLFPSKTRKGKHLTKEGIIYLVRFYGCRLDVEGWEKLVPRDWRRHLARRWILHEGNLLKLQEILRHDSPSSTWKYVNGLKFESELSRDEYDKIME